MKAIWLAPLALSLLAQPSWAQWTPQASGTKARLRGLSVVSSKVAWTSGSAGACLRTIDAGNTWVPRPVADASSLDFRDIHAVDADTAYLLSIGPGEKSRIYKTTDTGATWTLQFTNPDPKGFLDAIAFWNPDQGLALGDPVNGRFTILATDDAGSHWTPIPGASMPPTLPGEGAFAASGTCLIVQPDGRAWFATGGAKVSRVFRSTDHGKSWTAHETPVRTGNPSSGIFSLAFHDATHGIAVGGNYISPDESEANVALTTDGGLTWTLPKGTRPPGYHSAVASIPGAKPRTFLAVGPNGTDISINAGDDWKPLTHPGFDAVSFAAPNVGWAVGECGRIARFHAKIPEGR